VFNTNTDLMQYFNRVHKENAGNGGDTRLSVHPHLPSLK